MVVAKRQNALVFECAARQQDVADQPNPATHTRDCFEIILQASVKTEKRRLTHLHGPCVLVQHLDLASRRINGKLLAMCFQEDAFCFERDDDGNHIAKIQ